MINGNVERFFFVTDGSGTQTLMDQFGNGAVALTNADFAPPPVLICFCDGTKLSTPAGLQTVETLQAGDLVLTDKGIPKPIQWIARTEVSLSEMLRNPARRPVCIAADSIEPGVPFEDLYVSAQHRVVIKSAAAEILFDDSAVLVAAKHLLGTLARQFMPPAAISYYHILLEDHDMVVSNGLASETFQLNSRNFAGMSPTAKRSLLDTLSDKALEGYFGRPDKLYGLKSYEAKVLLREVLGQVESPTIVSGEPSVDRVVSAINLNQGL